MILVTLILFLNVIRSLLKCIKATIQLVRLFFFVFLVDELDCSPCSSLGFCVSQFSKLYIVILLDYKPHWISFFFLFFSFLFFKGGSPFYYVIRRLIVQMILNFLVQIFSTWISAYHLFFKYSYDN